MIARIAEIGIIILVVAWSLGIVAGAGAAVPASTPASSGTSFSSSWARFDSRMAISYWVF